MPVLHYLIISDLFRCTYTFDCPVNVVCDIPEGAHYQRDAGLGSGFGTSLDDSEIAQRCKRRWMPTFCQPPASSSCPAWLSTSTHAMSLTASSGQRPGTGWLAGPPSVRPGSLATRLGGYTAAPLHCCLASWVIWVTWVTWLSWLTWLPGCLAAWLHGCLAAWLPGCLAGGAACAAHV